MVYGRIIVGADGSPGSLAATGWAAQIAGTCGAEVALVHGLAPLLEHMFSIPPLESEVLVSLVKEELAGAWSEPLRRAAVEHEPVLVEDVAAAAVLSVARQKDASLIVLGRHGHTRWGPQHTMGGVVHKVLSAAICPVVIVPTSWEDRAADTSPDIVVGVDGSESSLAAIDWAIRHAEIFGMGVRAVTGVFTQVNGEVAWLVPTDDEKAKVKAEEELGRILEKSASGTDVDLAMRVAVGPVGATLVEESETAELIVVGSRGLGSVAALLVGSTSHYVATRSSCPAVIVTC